MTTTVHELLTTYDCDHAAVRISDTGGAFATTTLQIGRVNLQTKAMPATELADYLEAWAEKIRAANTDRYSGKKVA